MYYLFFSFGLKSLLFYMHQVSRIIWVTQMYINVSNCVVAGWHSLNMIVLQVSGASLEGS